MALGKSHSLNNNLFSVFNVFVALLEQFLDSMSIFLPWPFKFQKVGSRPGWTPHYTESQVSFQVDCKSIAKASDFKDHKE